MRQVAPETSAAYERRLERAEVPQPQRPDYHRWTRFYLDFCSKYGHPPRSPESLGPFLNKLASRNQTVEQRHQAAQAINLLIGPNPAPVSRDTTGTAQANPPPTSASPSRVLTPLSRQSRPASSPALRPALPPIVASPAPRGASWEKEYRELEACIKLRNYSPKTLETYRMWVAKFQAFVRSRPTAELGNDEVRGFLSELAVRHGVAASTQNQAFKSIVEG